MFAANDWYIIADSLSFYCSPMISTEDGNVKITSAGDLVLQPGKDGAVQVLSSSGVAMNMTGPQGPPVRSSHWSNTV